MKSISSMLPFSFCPQQELTEVGSKHIPADRYGSLFFLALGRHDFVCIILERLLFASLRCATFKVS